MVTTWSGFGNCRPVIQRDITVTLTPLARSRSARSHSRSVSRASSHPENPECVQFSYRFCPLRTTRPPLAF